MRNLKIGVLIPILAVCLVLGSDCTVLAETSISTSTVQSNSAQSSNSPSIQTDETTVNTSSSPSTLSGSSGTDSVNEAISKANSGQIFDIKAIPPGDAVSFVKGKFGQLFLFFKDLSYPYITLVIVLAGMVMIFPFKPHMKKYLGWSILGGGALGFFFIHFSPVIVGIFRGLTQQ